MSDHYMSYMAISWHLVILACSLCRSCRSDYLKTDGMMILEPLGSKPLSNVSLSHMCLYLWGDRVLVWMW